jgi:hypothetical protein
MYICEWPVGRCSGRTFCAALSRHFRDASAKPSSLRRMMVASTATRPRVADRLRANIAWTDVPAEIIAAGPYYLVERSGGIVTLIECHGSRHD